MLRSCCCMLAPCYGIYYDGPACSIRATSKYLVKFVQIKTAGLECLLEIEKFLKGPSTKQPPASIAIYMFLN